MNQELERDLDPPEPQEPIKIKKWCLIVQWEDGTTEEIALDHAEDVKLSYDFCEIDEISALPQR